MKSHQHKLLLVSILFYCLFIQITSLLPIPCSTSLIESYISPCDLSTNTRNIIYYFSKNCDQFSPESIPLPSPSLNILCNKCPLGTAFLPNQIECSLCPKNTYSTGNSLRFKGDLFEFAHSSFKDSFTNQWYYRTNTSDIVDNNTQGWTIEEDGSYIQPNLNPGFIDSLSLSNITSISRLVIQTTLISQARLVITYDKDNIFISSVMSSTGSFLIYVDHILKYEDNDTNIKEKDIIIDLSKGKHFIAFEYHQDVKTRESGEGMIMRISRIEIQGIDPVLLKCFPCEYGYSKEASDKCEFCSKGMYLDKATQKCIECPKGMTTTLADSYKCKAVDECNEASYQKVYLPICYTKTNKQFLTYKPIKDCYENEALALTGNNETNFSTKTVDCLKCPFGKFRYEIDAEHSKCLNCPKDTYSNTEDANACSLCLPDEGILSKISYYTHTLLSLSDSLINTEIEDNGGLMTIRYHLIDKTSSFKVKVQIDTMDAIVYTETIPEIALDKGKHSIIISGLNIIIDGISIKNTVNGLGYQCIKLSDNNEINCAPGNEYDTNLSKCVSCQGNTFRAFVGKKCTPCPLYSLASKDKTSCKMVDVISYTPDEFTYDLSLIKTLLSSKCSSNETMCQSNNYYGPFLSSKEQSSQFFLSANVFNSKDFLSLPSLTEHFPSGFVFKMSLSSFIPTNLGSELSFIKMVNGINHKGIILKATYGDNCLIKDKFLRYQSFIYIKCNDDPYENEQIKLVFKDQCNYYFELSSQKGCLICKEHQDFPADMNYCSTTPSLSLKQQVFKKYNQCIDSNIMNRNHVKSDKTNVIINPLTFSLLMKIYDITPMPDSSNKQTNTTLTLIEISCIHRNLYLVFILLIFLSFCVILTIGYIYCHKYSIIQRIIKGRYTSVAQVETHNSIDI